MSYLERGGGCVVLPGESREMREGHGGGRRCREGDRDGPEGIVHHALKVGGVAQEGGKRVVVVRRLVLLALLPGAAGEAAGVTAAAVV